MGIFNFIKSPGQLKTEYKTRQTIKKIRAAQALNSAMRGGNKSGLSGMAAGKAAGPGGLDFNGGVSVPKKKYR